MGKVASFIVKCQDILFGGVSVNIRDMECFLKICEQNSISAAAQSFFMTPQAVSKEVKRMEQELGTPLLFRSQKGVVPTEYGKVFLEHAAHMVAEFHDTAREITELHQQNEGFLRMVSAYGILRFLSPEFIRTFVEQSPTVHLDYMEYPDIYIEENVLNEKYDVGLVLYLHERDELTYIPLFSREIFFITHPGSRFYDCPEVSVRDITAETMIIENDNFLIHHIMEETCRREDADLDVYFNTSGFSLCYKLCKEHKGNTASMDFIFHDMGDMTLHRIPFHEHPRWNVALIHKKDVPLSDNLQCFIRHSQIWCRKMMKA